MYVNLLCVCLKQWDFGNYYTYTAKQSVHVQVATCLEANGTKIIE